MHFSALAHTPRAARNYCPSPAVRRCRRRLSRGRVCAKVRRRLHSCLGQCAKGSGRCAKGFGRRGGGFRAVRERTGRRAKGSGLRAKGKGRRAKGSGQCAKGQGFDAPDEGAFGHFHAVDAGCQPPCKIPVVPAVRRPQPVFCFLKTGFRILRRVKKCVKVRSSAKKVYLCTLVNAPLRILSHSRTPQGHFHSPLTAVKQIWKRTTNEP